MLTQVMLYPSYIHSPSILGAAANAAEPFQLYDISENKSYAKKIIKTN